jgi:hypothetical protein
MPSAAADTGPPQRSTHRWQPPSCRGWGDEPLRSAVGAVGGDASGTHRGLRVVWSLLCDSGVTSCMSHVNMWRCGDVPSATHAIQRPTSHRRLSGNDLAVCEPVRTILSHCASIPYCCGVTATGRHAAAMTPGSGSRGNRQRPTACPPHPVWTPPPQVIYSLTRAQHTEPITVRTATGIPTRNTAHSRPVPLFTVRLFATFVMSVCAGPAPRSAGQADRVRVCCW